ncbi:MAG: hypothetical protein WCA79_00600 [Anaerolineales bacterium]
MKKNKINEFRKAVYQSLKKRADILFDLIDALTVAGQVSSPVALSEQKPFRRKFESVYDGLRSDCAFQAQNGEMDIGEILSLLPDCVPEDSEMIAGYKVYAVDATANEHEEAETLPDRSALNSILYKIATYGNYFQLGVAFWTICWFLLISFVYVLDMKKYSILYILGTFASLSFGYLRQVSERIFPWDMPALFIFTIFVLLFHHKKYWWIFVLLPVGMGFKETTGILCLAFLFTDMPWKRRLAMFFAAIIFCIAIKFAIDLFVKEPIPFFTMEGVSANLTLPYFVSNIRSLKTLIPLLINAGTFLAFILFPINAQKIWALKTMAIAFVIGNMVFGSITEYRIWFEMIPFALYTFDLSLYGNRFMPTPETS